MENITVIETFDEKSPDMTLTTWLPYHTSSIEVQDAAGNITNNQTYFDFSAQKGLLDNYLIIIGIITVIIQLCSVFLNSVTLLMFLRNKVLRSSTNFFVLNLAVSDILMAVLVCSFSAVAAFTGSWPLDHIGCVWYGFGFTFFTATSINSMTAIAMERYYTVTKCQMSVNKMRRNASKVMLSIWCNAFLCAVPPIVGWSYYKLDTPGTTCSLNWEGHALNQITYPVFFCAICLIMPISFMIFCYYKVYHKVQESSRNIRLRSGSVDGLTTTTSSHGRLSTVSTTAAYKMQRVPSSISLVPTVYRMSTVSLMSNWSSVSVMSISGDMKTEKRLAKVMTFLILLVAVSWLPFGAMSILVAVSNSVPVELTVITRLFANACTVYNPLVYVFFNKKYRKNFLKVFGWEDCPGITIGDAGPADTNEGKAKYQPKLQPKRILKQTSYPVLTTIQELNSQTCLAGSRDNGLIMGPEVTSSGTQVSRKGKLSLPEAEIRQALRQSQDSTAELLAGRTEAGTSDEPLSGEHTHHAVPDVVIEPVQHKQKISKSGFRKNRVMDMPLVTQ